MTVEERTEKYKAQLEDELYEALIENVYRMAQQFSEVTYGAPISSQTFKNAGFGFPKLEKLVNIRTSLKEGLITVDDVILNKLTEE